MTDDPDLEELWRSGWPRQGLSASVTPGFQDLTDTAAALSAQRDKVEIEHLKPGPYRKWGQLLPNLGVNEAKAAATERKRPKDLGFEDRMAWIDDYLDRRGRPDRWKQTTIFDG